MKTSQVFVCFFLALFLLTSSVEMRETTKDEYKGICTETMFRNPLAEGCDDNRCMTMCVHSFRGEGTFGRCLQLSGPDWACICNFLCNVGL